MRKVIAEEGEINSPMAVVNRRKAWIGFASGVQQLPNILQPKNYNNTDEVSKSFWNHCKAERSTPTIMPFCPRQLLTAESQIHLQNCNTPSEWQIYIYDTKITSWVTRKRSIIELFHKELFRLIFLLSHISYAFLLWKVKMNFRNIL